MFGDPNMYHIPVDVWDKVLFPSQGYRGSGSGFNTDLSIQ